MPEGRDFLDRFRPAGAPGSAARAGVPADRARELADELDPVLALLDSTHAECERIIAGAGQEAERIMAAARSEAGRIAADAQTRARTARDEATRRLLAQAGERVAAAATAADAEADRARRQAAQRLPALVAKAVALVRAGPPQAPGHGASPRASGTTQHSVDLRASGTTPEGPRRPGADRLPAAPDSAPPARPSEAPAREAGRT